MLTYLKKKLGIGYPIPGKDFTWSALCNSCGKFSTHVSRFGSGGLDHCYSCGFETRMPPLPASTVKTSITRSWCHWLTFPLLPYDWHTKTEEEKWEILK